LHNSKIICNFALQIENSGMEFVRVIEDYDHLWAVKDPHKEYDELTQLFENWNNAEFLLDFFQKNVDDLKEYFHIERISQAVRDTMEDSDRLEELILDIPYTFSLDELFHPLSPKEEYLQELLREKARNWDRRGHDSWLRIYAIRLEPNVYVITGGAIKLTRTMQDREHTQFELDKLNTCRTWFQSQGVFDKDSFLDCMEVLL